MSKAIFERNRQPRTQKQPQEQRLDLEQQAYGGGWEAFDGPNTLRDNPYPTDSSLGIQWAKGFRRRLEHAESPRKQQRREGGAAGQMLLPGCGPSDEAA